MKQIYIVDDDFEIIYSVTRWLRNKNYDVRSYSGSIPLFEGLSSGLPSAILLDIHLGDEDGRQICKEIRKVYSDQVPIILYSMIYNSITDLKDGCADDYIRKDVTLQELTRLLQEHMQVENEDH